MYGYVAGGLVASGVVLFKVFNDQILAKFISNFSDNYNDGAEKQKTLLFEKLNQMAKDVAPKKLKVLEIGGGSGTNFKFVTQPVEWTVTEPNTSFAPYFKKNVEPWTGLHTVSDLVEAKAEDLSKFEDASFDAVIETLVLCTVKDVDASLAEIRRVLKPETGTFFFLDHVKAPSDYPKTVTVQNTLTGLGIWPFFFGNCQLNRPIQEAVRKSGLFSTVHTEQFIYQPKKEPNMVDKQIIKMIQHQTIGWAKA